jgi:hypothetical protein
MIRFSHMVIKKGDEVGVTVTKEWADAVGPIPALHYFDKDETLSARLFVAQLVSITDSEGLWVESVKSIKSQENDRGLLVLVPWRFILAVQTSPGMQIGRAQPGFLESN